MDEGQNTMKYDEFKIKIVDDIAIVTVDLLVATQRDAKPLWEELETTTILEWDKVIVDLSQCTFIDSTFVGMLVRIYKVIKNNTGKMRLVFPENNMKLYFHTTGITRIVECFDTLNDAIDSFSTKIPTRKILFDQEFNRN